MGNYLIDGLLASASLERPFAEIPASGDVKTRYYSYQDVLDVSARLANSLVGFGVKPGDRVAVQVPKSIEALMLYLATVRAGAVFLPLNTAYTAGEISYFVEDAAPTLFVCAPQDEELYATLADQSNCTLRTMGVWTGPEQSAGTLLDDGLNQPTTFENVAREADDLAAILYTSGTTGRSKGAMLTHDNLLSNSIQLRDIWRFDETDVLLHALPIFHTHGLFVATNVTLLAGASMILLPGFSMDGVLEALPRATTMMGVPTFYTRMLDDPRFTGESCAHMRLFVSGSAPLLAETHVAFEARTGQRILERYGMTETNMNTSNPYDGERRAGTVGFPLPGVDLRVTDAETGNELPRGEVGMIEVKGPNVFAGYWNMPDKTAEEFRGDGFFITGDLGRIDDDGYVHIVGRGKDLIISGGFNVYPKEVELVLDEQPGVIESAVIGVPHPDFGEAVMAVVVRAEGSDIAEEGIQSALAGQLAKFKCPKCVFFLDALPRNTMGKVQKNILRDQFGATFQS